MIKEEAIALQAVVDEILALAVEKRSEIGGAVNWGDLLCLDVEVSRGRLRRPSSFAGL